MWAFKSIIIGMLVNISKSKASLKIVLSLIHSLTISYYFSKVTHYFSKLLRSTASLYITLSPTHSLNH